MPWSLLAHSCGSLSPVSVAWSGRDASPSQVIPPQFVRFPQQFAGTHLYSWVERCTVRVKCLAQEHNTVSPARDRTRTTRCGGTSALTVRPPRLPSTTVKAVKIKPEKIQAWTRFYPRPLRYRHSALPTELLSQLGVGHVVTWNIPARMVRIQSLMFYREQWLQ